jgi:Domain of unknown function (DUF6468)
MNILGLIIDAVVMALLIVTVVYCSRLNRRLKALHTGQDGLKDVVAALDRATERAQASLAALKTDGETAADLLKREREKADRLLDELKLIVGAADRVANRLTEMRAPAAPAPPAEPRAPAGREVASGEIYQALRQAR